MKRKQVTIGLVAAVLAAIHSGCAEQSLRAFRNDGFLDSHVYALGENNIDVRGMRLCYQDVGSGPCVMILPGLGTSIDFWQLNIPALAERHRVVAVDPPGFGKSDKPDVPYDLDWIRDVLFAFMDAKGIERASVMGGSMGGHLALLMALESPQRVDRLVVMGSSGAWPAPGVILSADLQLLWNDALVSDYLRCNWPAIFDKMFLRQTEVTRGLLRYQLAVRADAARYAPEGRAASRALRSIFFHSCTSRLEQIESPTLLVWGAKDSIHPLDEAERFLRGIPDARLVIIPDAAHEAMIDRADEFNRVVLAFLEGSLDGSTQDLARGPLQPPPESARRNPKEQ